MEQKINKKINNVVINSSKKYVIYNIIIYLNYLLFIIILDN